MYATRSSDTLRVYDAYLYRDGLKNIPGRYFDADDKAWVLPYTDEAVRTLELLGARLGDGIEPSSQSKAVAKKYETINTQPRVKATLYAHQVRAYNFALEMLEEGRAAAIFADMGTGKTLITISTVGTLYEQERIHKMLVVCPKSIVGVWEEEFRKFADFRYALTVLDGTLDKKKSTFKYMNGTALQVIVVNYESCWRLEKEVAKWRPDIIVCDESSKIKNPQTAQSKALHRLGRISKYNMILTGTPTTGSPLDFSKLACRMHPPGNTAQSASMTKANSPSKTRRSLRRRTRQDAPPMRAQMASRISGSVRARWMRRKPASPVSKAACR